MPGIRHETRRANLNARGQALLYYARRATRGRRDPSLELLATQVFDPVTPNAGFFTSSLRQRPITFRFDVTLDGVGDPLGLILEFGGTNPGLKIGLAPTGHIEVAAGGTGASGVNGREPISAAVGVPDSFVVTVHPGFGTIQVWERGNMIMNERAANGSFTQWADSQFGSVGSDENISSTQETQTTINLAPVNFVISSQVQVFSDQIPQQFRTP